MSEAGKLDEVVAVSIGVKQAQETQGTALASAGLVSITNGALGLIKDKIEKGPMLVAGFQKALLEPLPTLRQAEVQRRVGMIRN